MTLNVNTETYVFKISLDSGIVLNMQIPKPVIIKAAANCVWGNIGGDINNQTDLMKRIKKAIKLAKAAL